MTKASWTSGSHPSTTGAKQKQWKWSSVIWRSFWATVWGSERIYLLAHYLVLCPYLHLVVFLLFPIHGAVIFPPDTSLLFFRVSNSPSDCESFVSCIRNQNRRQAAVVEHFNSRRWNDCGTNWNGPRCWQRRPIRTQHLWGGMGGSYRGTVGSVGL